ncbi:MAG: tyrosine-protein phosphatase, partial [Thermomicrobiales bacterium]
TFTISGRIIRSDSLQNLTEAGRTALVAYGVRTIIDLRLPVELEHGPNSFASNSDASVTYVHRSLLDPTQAREVTNASTLAEHYRNNLKAGGERIAAILETIAEAPDGGVLFHCQGGQDRTGLISAFLLDIAGVPAETIVADYVLTQVLLSVGTETFLATFPPEKRAEIEEQIAFFTPAAHVMSDTLAFLDQEFGSPIGYLRGAGVSESTTNRLRDRLLTP